MFHGYLANSKGWYQLMEDEFWKDRNVLVTGCTGLLGSWLTKSLVEKEANVVGLIRDLVPRSNLNWSGFNNKITTVRGEIEDYFLLERAINEYEIDAVFHLAAQTIVTIANRNPISTFKANIEGTWNILEACRRSPSVKRIIVASSEKTTLEGRHPYDVSKSCADLICRSYYESYCLPVCVTRCGNFYGGGDLNYNRIVPGTIRSISNNKRPIIRSDGTNLRDYFYIKDGVKSYMLLAEKMENKNIHGEAFNFSTEHPISVLEVVNKIISLMESNLEPKILNSVSNEIKDQYLSAKKAKARLNWLPSYTLDEGLKETVQWYRVFFKGILKDIYL
jgi:CDP-glucose 4,6-dehydratase